MRIEVTDLNGETFTHDVDHLSYVNQESFGKGEEIGLARVRTGQKLLVVNVNAMLSVEIAK